MQDISAGIVAERLIAELERVGVGEDAMQEKGDNARSDKPRRHRLCRHDKPS